MDVLASRILLRPSDPDRSRRFYGEQLGLAVAREFGDGPGRGTVYFAGGGFIELSGSGGTGAGDALRLWLQVRDVDAAHRELLAKGVTVLREPLVEPWGLKEMWVADPDGVRIGIIEVPEDHPIRRDPRAPLRVKQNLDP